MASGKEHYDRDKFFEAVRKAPFPGKLFQDHVDGMNAILDAWEPTPFKDRRCLAYILATAKAETGTMQPREEIGKGRGYAYGKPDPITGNTYYGRGLVQITWKENYEKAQKQINDRDLVGAKIDLVNKPEQALNMAVATTILIYGMEEGWFTGKKLSDYLNDTKTDYVNARRVVNGTDRAHEIAGDAQAFYAALTAVATEREPEQPPKPDEEESERDPLLTSWIEQIKGRTGARNLLLEF